MSVGSTPARTREDWFGTAPRKNVVREETPPVLSKLLRAPRCDPAASQPGPPALGGPTSGMCRSPERDSDPRDIFYASKGHSDVVKPGAGNTRASWKPQGGYLRSSLPK